MNQVQPWVGHRLHTIQTCTQQEVSDHSWSDDRLALVLDTLSDDQKWQQLETALTGRMVGVYNLKPQRVGLDSTTANG